MNPVRSSAIGVLCGMGFILGYIITVISISNYQDDAPQLWAVYILGSIIGANVSIILWADDKNIKKKS